MLPGGRGGWTLEFFQSPMNRAARNPRDLCYRRHTPVSQRTRFQSSGQAKLPLVEMWHQRQQPILKSLGVGHIYNIQKSTNLFKLICGGL